METLHAHSDSVPPDAHDRDSAEAFVQWCVNHVGLGYHPDTAFEDYINSEGGPSFTPEEIRSLNALNERAFAFCDPYDIGLAEVRRQLAAQGLL